MSQSNEMSALIVSVIVPCYNSNLQWLTECLLSVVQALDAFDGEGEVLVIDDGSESCIESGMKELLTGETLSELVFAAKQMSLSSTRNFGMRHTRVCGVISSI